MREMLTQRAQLEGPEGPLEEKGVMLPPNFPSPQCPLRESVGGLHQISKERLERPET